MWPRNLQHSINYHSPNKRLERRGSFGFSQGFMKRKNTPIQEMKEELIKIFTWKFSGRIKETNPLISLSQWEDKWIESRRYTQDSNSEYSQSQQEPKRISNTAQVRIETIEGENNQGRHTWELRVQLADFKPNILHDHVHPKIWGESGKRHRLRNRTYKGTWPCKTDDIWLIKNQVVETTSTQNSLGTHMK